MKSFYEVTRAWYIKAGYSFKEASRHARADHEMWHELFTGKKA